ncbi:hypothetical protein EON65_12825 [archaeon]|nr:MAG: hypothetical protein EON65_12825 [archaeon]
MYVISLGAPIYNVPGCEGKLFRSCLVGHISCTATSLDQLLHTSSGPLTVAVNSFCSCSGWLMLLAELGKITPTPSISKIIQTGSCAASLRLVSEGKATIAAVDVVSFHLAQLYYPALTSYIKVLGYTDPSLSLPFVTHKHHSDAVKERIKSALRDACAHQSSVVGSSADIMRLRAVDTTVTFQDYVDSINSLVEKATSAYPVLMEKLTPGMALDCVLQLEEGTSVESIASIEEGDYLHYESQFLGYLAHSLVCVVVKEICLYHSRHNIPSSDMTLESIVKAVDGLVKQEVWRQLPHGASKIVLCSTQGVLQLIESVLSSECEKVMEVDRECTERLRVVMHHSKRPQSTEEGMYAAGFMGRASSKLSDCFGHTDTDNLLATLWAVDFSLSDRLIQDGESLGLVAYVSAPRLNNRGDWGNLVISHTEQGLVAWRDSMSHSAARRYVAPHCYEHIRLHRGVLTYSEQHTHWFSTLPVSMKQTVFLRSVDASEVDGGESKPPPFYVNKADHYEQELRHMLGKQQEKFTELLNADNLISALAHKKTFLREVISYRGAN